jgi:5-methylcytosine-specific restriction protein B
MVKDASFVRLTEIIAQAADYPEGGPKNSKIKDVLGALFGSRYHLKSLPKEAFRDAYGLKDEGVPYAGIIAPENPPSGAYGGASLAWFPCDDGTLMTLVVGTKGLAPDEGLLTRHGHRRRVLALRSYLARHGIASWSKADPAAISTPIPESARRTFSSCDAVFKRYGEVIYAASWVSKGDTVTAGTVTRAYLDLYARERGWSVLKPAEDEYNGLFTALHEYLFPAVTPAAVNALLRGRRFVVLQGPPGTGKTRMADMVRTDFFKGRGKTVQFHPAVTYEDFVVGLAPDPVDAGLRFTAKPGWLLQAAAEAADAPYVLVIDEINRGDLGKILGEAIYLFEPGEVGGPGARAVSLPHPVNGTSTFKMPANLYVLGTMNTADRSIAGIDLAVRRRFAFVTLMPDPRVIELDAARKTFDALTDIFVEHASDDMLHLLPGHSYFLAQNDAQLRERYHYELLPLLDEYLRQGLLGPATSDLHAVRERIADFVAQDPS